MLKIYYVIANVIIVYGFIGPYLISSTHNEFVILGVLILPLNAYHLSVLLIKLIKRKKVENEKD